jgi:hypothetical protein
MARWIPFPTVVEAAGHPPKRIEEYVGRVSTGSDAVSVARMASPAGWTEPGQTPRFHEITVVLAGELHAQLRGGGHTVRAGQALHVGARRVGALQHARGRRLRVDLPAGLLTGYRPSRRCLSFCMAASPGDTKCDSWQSLCATTPTTAS